jgi:hypothetical protein
LRSTFRRIERTAPKIIEALPNRFKLRPRRVRKLVRFLRAIEAQERRLSQKGNLIRGKLSPASEQEAERGDSRRSAEPACMGRDRLPPQTLNRFIVIH